MIKDSNAAATGAPSRASTPAPAPRWRLRVTMDRVLTTGGVAAAFCSIAFAGYMIGDRDRQPYFPGQEYLAIFARPSRGLPVAAAHPSPPLAHVAASGDPTSIDPTPTGAIAPGADPPAGASPPDSHYRLVSVDRGEAWVENGTGFRKVKAGDVLPALGRVEAIEKRNGHWFLETASGVALELSDAALDPSSGPGPERRFARRMIFGR
ncbi:MAG TPA: hypothetical protein VKS78_08190 [Roseiarcus sp.]|nr:hypothetical protein [Roseiarcus sp.]